jgi:quercetin dioxygenase-like cupin family protein
MMKERAESINIFDKLVKELPERGIFSQTLLKNDHSSVVLMQLAAGEELSEHTSKFPSMVYVIGGEGDMVADGKTYRLSKGEIVSMAAELPHSVTADKDLDFLLYLFKSE